SDFCLLPSALCLPPTKITKSCQEPHYPLSDKVVQLLLPKAVQNLLKITLALIGLTYLQQLWEIYQKNKQ
ncbi:MAG: hypothetical protein V7L23_10275, partial [Nostoc sp.]|uniref:hypothetical protein n=1 Tax=Nostoc sp. TaxID=1180 RepID=UPI002FF08BAA